MEETLTETISTCANGNCQCQASNMNQYFDSNKSLGQTLRPLKPLFIYVNNIFSPKEELAKNAVKNYLTNICKYNRGALQCLGTTMGVGLAYSQELQKYYAQKGLMNVNINQSFLRTGKRRGEIRNQYINYRKVPRSSKELNKLSINDLSEENLEVGMMIHTKCHCSKKRCYHKPNDGHHWAFYMGNGRIFDNVSAFGAGNSKCRTCFNKKVRYKGCKAFNRCLQEKCFGKNKCNPENPESCTVSIKKFAQNIGGWARNGISSRPKSKRCYGAGKKDTPCVHCIKRAEDVHDYQLLE